MFQPIQRAFMFLFMSIMMFSSCSEEEDLIVQKAEPIDYTTIPDVNFEEQLIAKGIDSDGIVNHLMLSKDANEVTVLDLSFPEDADPDKRIIDLTGIEAFKNLITLSVPNNDLTSISLMANTALETLDLNSNQLTTIDLSSNEALSYLDAGFNALEEIDLKTNINLKTLKLQLNYLKSIDVSNNPNLIELDLYFNELSSITGLNVTKKLITTNLSWNYLEELAVNIPSLEGMNVEQNFLTTLNVNGCTSLKYMIATTNLINTLDLSSNVALQLLLVSANQIENINLDNNVQLELLWISSNQLTNLDLSNLSMLYEISVGRNSQLNCIKIASNQTIATVKKEEYQELSIDGC